MKTANKNLLGKFVSTSEVVMIFADSTVTCNSSNPKFAEVKALVEKGEYEKAAALSSVEAQINSAFAGTSVEVSGNEVLYAGKPVHNVVVDRILRAIKENVDATPIAKFLDRLMRNPSFTAVKELYLFLECNKIPLTEDGCFLAWKKVRPDFKDIYSGTLDYTPGNRVVMPRNEVDEDRNRTCSKGLHCAGWDYLPHFGDTFNSRIVIVKVDPAHVVAVPSDYGNAKMRVSEMLVLREYLDKVNEAKEFSACIVGNQGESICCGDCCVEDEDEDEGWNEYSDHDAGYDAGVDDYESGLPPENDLDASAEWQDGYRKGYLEASNL